MRVVGIVVVSHSGKLAEGVKELADSLTGGRVPVAAAGGLDESTLGTSAERIVRAVQGAWRGEGVLVLVDLGSAVLNTRLALDLLPEEVGQKTVLSTAPLVEGALAAALRADAGGDLRQVVEAAWGARSFPKGEEAAVPGLEAQAAGLGDRVEGVVTVVNAEGMHARSAARLVEEVRKWGAVVTICKVGGGGAPVRGDSLVGLLGLGGRPGEQLRVAVEGEKAQEVLDSIQELFASGFGENVTPP